MTYFVYCKQKWQECTAADVEALLQHKEIQEIDPVWDLGARQWTTVGTLRNISSSRGTEFSASSRPLGPADSIEKSIKAGKLRLTNCQTCGVTNRVFRGNYPPPIAAVCGTCGTPLPYFRMGLKSLVLERASLTRNLISTTVRKEKWACVFGSLITASVVYLSYPRTLWLSHPLPSLFWVENLPAALLVAVLLSGTLAVIRRRHEAQEILKFRQLYDALRKNEAQEEFARRQRASGLEMFEGQWLKKNEIDRILGLRIGLANNFQNITPYEFEQIVARLFRAMGFSCEVTSKSGDYGVDVVARKGTETVAIQCKRNSDENLVGNRTITMLVGAMLHIRTRATRGIVVTTSGFTRQAKHQAEGCPIELWDKSRLHHEIEMRIREI